MPTYLPPSCACHRFLIGMPLAILAQTASSRALSWQQHNLRFNNPEVMRGMAGCHPLRTGHWEKKGPFCVPAPIRVHQPRAGPLQHQHTKLL